MNLSDDQITDHLIWEMLSGHRGIERLAEDRSPEMQANIRTVASRLNMAFSLIERISLDGLDSVPRGKCMDDQRSYIHELPCSEVVLAMYDGDEYAQIIWQMIEPGKSIYSNAELAEAIELLRLVVKMDDYRWPEIRNFLSNVERSGWVVSS